MAEVSWLPFIVASLVLIVTPGQDMVLVMPRSIAQAAGAGVATAAGVSVGLVGHTLAAPLQRRRAGGTRPAAGVRAPGVNVRIAKLLLP